jgi:hypothetical protein
MHHQVPGTSLGLAQSYELFDQPGDGAEVFPLMREGTLDPDDYLVTFFDPGNEPQSGLTGGHKGITKAGGTGLRQVLYMVAHQARRVDPTLAERYHRLVAKERKHHISALNSVAAVLMTRIAACSRKGSC